MWRNGLLGVTSEWVSLQVAMYNNTRSLLSTTMSTVTGMSFYIYWPDACSIIFRRHEAQPCHCGEPNCVGFIGGKTQTDIGAMDDLYLDGNAFFGLSFLPFRLIMSISKHLE